MSRKNTWHVARKVVGNSSSGSEISAEFGAFTVSPFCYSIPWFLLAPDVHKQTQHMKQLTTTLHRSATSVTSYEFHYIAALDPDVVWQPKWMTICLEAWGQMELRKYLLTEKIISMLWSMDIMHDYLYIIWYMDFVFKVQYCSRSRSYESQRIIHTHDTLYDCIIV